jgi:hypothetical protein
MTCIVGFDPNAFGPFGAIFQNYLSTLESLGQGKTASAADVGVADFDPQSLPAQATAPLKAIGLSQLELLGLANRRTQAYLQLPTRLAQCRTPQDLVNEQMAFWRTASEQYTGSARKVAEVWAQAFPWIGTPAWVQGEERAARPERDYISFNGTGKGAGTAGARTEAAGKQRRVA